METKVQGVVKWLNKVFGRKEVVVTTPDRPSVVRLPDHTLETFTYEGYDIEVRIYSHRDLHLSAFLKGQCCLDGCFSRTEDWVWNPHPTSLHIPGYKVRLYLKQWAQARIDKE